MNETTSQAKPLGDVRVDSNKGFAHGASNINLSFIVDETDATAAMQKLHADFFREFAPAVFEEPS